jgi:hypothetical protein
MKQNGFYAGYRQWVMERTCQDCYIMQIFPGLPEVVIT